MSNRFGEFLNALRRVQEVMCDVEAWNNDDDNYLLNRVAFSGIGGVRYEELREPIRQAQSLAAEVLEFGQTGLINRMQARAIREEGFQISDTCRSDFVALNVPPAQWAFHEFEEEIQGAPRDERQRGPETMSLLLINFRYYIEGDSPPYTN